MSKKLKLPQNVIDGLLALTADMPAAQRIDMRAKKRGLSEQPTLKKHR